MVEELYDNRTNEDKENPYAELITLCPYCHKIVSLKNKSEHKLKLLKILEQRNIIGWTKNIYRRNKW